MTIGYGDLRKGMAIELDGQPYIVAEYASPISAPRCRSERP